MRNDSKMLGFWFGLDKDILFNELMSSFSKDSQKLQVFLISQFITQHLSPAIGLFVFSRLILLISNPLWLISSFSAGIKWLLTNSWNGFFSTGSSFFGLGIVFEEETCLSISTFGAELFFELMVFSFLIFMFSWLSILPELDTFNFSVLVLLLLLEFSVLFLLRSKFSSLERFHLYLL